MCDRSQCHIESEFVSLYALWFFPGELIPVGVVSSVHPGYPGCGGMPQGRFKLASIRVLLDCFDFRPICALSSLLVVFTLWEIRIWISYLCLAQTLILVMYKLLLSTPNFSPASMPLPLTQFMSGTCLALPGTQQFLAPAMRLWVSYSPVLGCKAPALVMCFCLNSPPVLTQHSHFEFPLVFGIWNLSLLPFKCSCDFELFYPMFICVWVGVGASYVSSDQNPLVL
jgi:hypothetical protein